MLPKLSALLVPLKESLYHVLEAKEKAQIFLTEASNGIDIVIRIQNRTSLTLENKKILSNFAKNNSIIRMVFYYRKVTDIVYETELPFVLFDNIRVKVDAHSFLQSSAVADLILAELVLKASVLQLNPLPCSQKIVDLFCGRGTYTLPLSGKYQVDGFESDKTALRDLDIAISESKRPIKLEKRDLFLDPLDAKELEPYFFAIINPPRAGALAQSIQLASSNISRICYISCNPETFARDASIICESKYKLTEVTPLDQFYWSPHLEVIGIFDKIS
jgi:23S rRNA (uracil1939-C5)-methyltransferase